MNKFFKQRLRDFIWYVMTTYLPLGLIILFIALAANYWPDYLWVSTVGFITFIVVVWITVIWKKG